MVELSRPDAPSPGTPDTAPSCFYVHISTVLAEAPSECQSPTKPKLPRKQRAARNLPPVGIDVYAADSKVIRSGTYPKPEQLEETTRGEIEIFSAHSASRLTRLARNASPALVSQFCLTYHEATPDGPTAKKHLNSWLMALRRAAPGVGYLWILEFQSRGVPHFHVWLTCNYSETLWKRLGKAWNRIAEPTSPQHLWWHTEERTDPKTGKVQRAFIDWDMKGAGYLRKYMSKEAQKCVPDGFGWCGRFWGATRGLAPLKGHIPAQELPCDIVDVTRTISKWSEARRKRGANSARQRAARKGQKYVPLVLHPTVRHTPTSGWVNNSTPVLLKYLDHKAGSNSFSSRFAAGELSPVPPPGVDPATGEVLWDDLPSISGGE